jgi:hypothetical protein
LRHDQNRPLESNACRAVIATATSSGRDPAHPNRALEFKEGVDTLRAKLVEAQAAMAGGG